MIEQISNLMTDAGASQVQLIINQIPGTNEVTVNLVTMLPPATPKESAQALKLRAALSQTLTISGLAGDIDVQIVEALTQFTDTYTEGVAAHSNLLDVKASIEQASKGASSQSKAKAKPANSRADDKQVSAPAEDEFLSGDADSL